MRFSSMPTSNYVYPWLNWIEFLTTNQEVTGSSPVGYAIFLVKIPITSNIQHSTPNIQVKILAQTAGRIRFAQPARIASQSDAGGPFLSYNKPMPC